MYHCINPAQTRSLASQVSCRGAQGYRLSLCTGTGGMESAKVAASPTDASTWR